MEKNPQLYYTQEGQPYQLKQVSRNLPLNGVGATLVPEFIVNAPASAIDTNSYSDIFLNTPKAILPLMMYYTVVNSPTNPPVCDIATPYWFNATGSRNFGYLKGLSKILPNIELIDNTSNLIQRYGLKYNQIVLSDEDFIICQNSNVFRFMPNQYWALTRQGTSYITVPAGIISITQVVLYFELQK